METKDAGTTIAARRRPGKRDFCRANPDGTACNWWLRSVNADNTNNFRNVNTDGSSNNNNANYSNGFAPGFKREHGVRTSSGMRGSTPKLKGGFAPWRLALGKRASFQKWLHDTEARTLLAWQGILAGFALVA